MPRRSADTLRATAIHGGWTASLFNPWQDYLPRLEQQMAAAEASTLYDRLCQRRPTVG